MTPTGEELNSNNAQNEVQNQQLTPSMMAALEDLVKDNERKKAEEELEKKRNATYEALKQHEAYPVLKEGGIDEMIQKNRAILDSQAALELAIQSTKQNIEMKKMQTSQQAQEQPKENPFNPANPVGTPAAPSQDDRKPLNSQQLMEKAMKGEVTGADIEKVRKNKSADPFLMYHAQQSVANNKGGDNSVVNSIERMRAALGTK